MNLERKFFRVTRWARSVRFWAFLLLAAFAWLGFGGDANAACVGGVCDTRPEAYALVNALPCPGHVQSCSNRTTVHFERNSPGNSSDYLMVQAIADFVFGDGTVLLNRTIGYAYYRAGCPAGAEWDDVLMQCHAGCADKPPLGAGAVRGAATACLDGCAYQQDGDVTVCLGEGPTIFCSARSWSATGSTCSVAKPLESFNPDAPVCMSTGGSHSECVSPDGRKCVTGAQGGRFCWEAGETGPRSNSQGTEGASNTLEGQTPVKPSNMPDGVATPGTTTTINNSTTITTSWTGAGGTPGQGNTGTGGRDGPGDGEGDGEGDGPGSVGAGLGTLYESDGKTVESVYGEFQARVENAPIRGAVAGFFAAPAGGGCPTFTLPATGYWDVQTFDYHCSGALATMLSYMGYLVLAVAAFFAVRIAIE